MQAVNNVLKFLSGKAYILLIAALVLVLVHLRSSENLPFSPNYTFPLLDFAIHFLGTLILWEIQIWNFRHFYERKLYEQGFSLKLVWQVLAINISFTAIFYTVFAPSVLVWVYRVPFSIYGFVIGLLLSLLFSLVINLAYLGLQVYRYWKYTSQHTATPDLTSANEVTKLQHSQVYLKTGNEELQLPYQEIAYFYSEEKVVFVITRTGKRLITQYTLAELETLLNPTTFFQISRQIIAHRQTIRSVRKAANYKLLVKLEVNGQAVKEETVSRYRAAAFREWFKGDLHYSE